MIAKLYPIFGRKILKTLTKSSKFKYYNLKKSVKVSNTHTDKSITEKKKYLNKKTPTYLFQVGFWFEILSWLSEYIPGDPNGLMIWRENIKNFDKK